MMKEKLLVELTFRGSVSVLKFDFLKEVLMNARVAYFTYPETLNVTSSTAVFQALNSESYMDLVINTDHFNVDGKIIQRVFININKNNDQIELFLFFDLMDLQEITFKTRIDWLKKWADNMKSESNFANYVCVPESYEEENFLFDSTGLGPAYYDFENTRH